MFKKDLTDAVDVRVCFLAEEFEYLGGEWRGVYDYYRALVHSPARPEEVLCHRKQLIGQAAGYILGVANAVGVEDEQLFRDALARIGANHWVTSRLQMIGRRRRQPRAASLHDAAP